MKSANAFRSYAERGDARSFTAIARLARADLEMYDNGGPRNHEQFHYRREVLDALIAVAISMRVISVLKRDCRPDAWAILCALSQSDVRSAFFDEFTQQRACQELLGLIVKRLLEPSTRDSELCCATAFLIQYLWNSEKRQRMVLCHKEMVTALLATINTRFASGDESFRGDFIHIMHVLTDTHLHPQLFPVYSVLRHEVLLWNRALPTLASAFYTLVSDLGKPGKHGDNCNCMPKLTATLAELFRAANSNLPSQRGVPQTVLRLDRNGQYRMCVALHRLLQSKKCPAQVIWCAVEYGHYLLRYEAEQAFKLFAGFGRSTTAMLILLQSCSVECNARMEDMVRGALAAWQRSMPSLLGEGSPRAEPGQHGRERAGRDRHSALPGCTVDGHGLVNPMKKCARCRAVYYCSLEHQKEH